MLVVYQVGIFILLSTAWEPYPKPANYLVVRSRIQCGHIRNLDSSAAMALYRVFSEKLDGYVSSLRFSCQ